MNEETWLNFKFPKSKCPLVQGYPMEGGPSGKIMWRVDLILIGKWWSVSWRRYDRCARPLPGGSSQQGTNPHPGHGQSQVKSLHCHLFWVNIVPVRSPQQFLILLLKSQHLLLQPPESKDGEWPKKKDADGGWTKDVWIVQVEPMRRPVVEVGRLR